MSTLTERARMESEETEAAEEEETPTEPTEPTEPEPEPEPAPEPQGLTEKDAEKLSKAADRAAATYIDKIMPIAQTLGWPVEPCPLCELPGLAQVRSADQVTSDVEAAVLRMIGKAQPPDYNVSDQYHRCTACDGWGEVLTGAQKEISRTAICNPCGGKGFVLGPIQVPPPVAANGAYTPPTAYSGPVGLEPPKPEPYYDYGTREWKLPPQANV